MATSRSVTRHMTARYLVTLGMLTALALANYLILRAQIHSNYSIAAIVNLSGRQRSLLRESVLLSQQLVSAPAFTARAASRQELLETVQEMESAHETLIRTNIPAAERGGDSDTTADLNADLRNYLSEVRELTKAPDEQLVATNAHLNYIRRESSVLFAELDAVVSSFQAYGEAKSDRLTRLSNWSFVSTVLVLALTGRFVFRPMARRVGQYIGDLNELNDTLEQRVDERTTLANERAEELARSEDALRSQTNLLQLILESLGDGVVVVQSDNTFLLLNAAARRMLKIGDDDELPSGWSSEGFETFGLRLYFPDGKTRFPDERSPLIQAMEGERVDRCELLLHHQASNETVNLSVTARPLHDESCRLRGAVGVLRDVTQQKRTEVALQDSEALHRSLVDNLPLCVLRKDLEGTFTFVNELVCRMLGKSCEEIVGKKDQDFYPAELARKYRRDDAIVVETGQVVEDIEKHVAPDGRLRHVEVLKAPVRDAAQEVVGIQTVFWDVTDRKLAEQRALQAERLAAIGQMVAGVAHESRNALQQIQACSRMLEWELDDDNTEARELIADLLKAQERLRRLFEDLRGYASSSKLDLRRTDLGELLGEAWDEVESTRHGKKADLERLVRCQDLNCTVDPFKLEQVFRNILENAVAACDEPVRISATFQEANGRRPCLRVDIRDNGPGLTAEQKAHIFDPFYSTKSEGSGLGMAIAKRIVESHNGRIDVHSDGPTGTQVSITLPREDL